MPARYPARSRVHQWRGAEPRVGKVVVDRPLSEMSDRERREFHEARPCCPDPSLCEREECWTVVVDGRPRTSAFSETTVEHWRGEA